MGSDGSLNLGRAAHARLEQAAACTAIHGCRCINVCSTATSRAALAADRSSARNDTEFGRLRSMQTAEQGVGSSAELLDVSKVAACRSASSSQPAMRHCHLELLQEWLPLPCKQQLAGLHFAAWWAFQHKWENACLCGRQDLRTGPAQQGCSQAGYRGRCWQVHQLDCNPRCQPGSSPTQSSGPIHVPWLHCRAYLRHEASQI